MSTPPVSRRGNRHSGSGSRAALARRLGMPVGPPRETRARIWRLHPVQHAFVHSPARFCFYVGGIGSGKSYAGAVKAILRAASQRGSLGLVGAPTYPMLRDATERMLLDRLPRQLIRERNRNEGRLALVNGSEILFRSLSEPDRVRGLNLAWFWLDEAPLCGYEAWQLLKGRLRQAGFAPAGWATGTPRGRDGFARDFELAPQPEHALFRASTHANAANLPDGYVAALGYTGQFALQEIEGLFVAFEGLVYRFEASEGSGHVRRWPGGPFARVVGGVDWGYTNPTAAVVFGFDGDQRAWQIAEYYQRRAGLREDVLPALVALSRAHGVQRWYADDENPEAIRALAQALAAAGLTGCQVVPAAKGPGSVRAGIQTVVSALAARDDGTRGLYVDPACVATIAEYGTYAYATADGDQRDASELPLKQADHAMDATRYALHGELTGWARTEAYLEGLRRRPTT